MDSPSFSGSSTLPRYLLLGSKTTYNAIFDRFCGTVFSILHNNNDNTAAPPERNAREQSDTETSSSPFQLYHCEATTFFGSQSHSKNATLLEKQLNQIITKHNVFLGTTVQQLTDEAITAKLIFYSKQNLPQDIKHPNSAIRFLLTGHPVFVGSEETTMVLLLPPTTTTILLTSAFLAAEETTTGSCRCILL